MSNLFKRIKEYFSIKQMKKEIYGYGYTCSGIKYFFFIIACFLVTFISGIIYQMSTLYMIPIFIVCFISTPKLIRVRFVNLYQKKRFNEVDIYLHQMVYSFQKMPKISVALEDTIKISSGKLKKTLEAALDTLYNSTSENVLTEALTVIEKEYNNSRIKALNKYMVNVEMRGGDYATSINIMLTDIDNWINRTYAEQHEIDRVKQANIVGLALSFIMGGISSVFSIVMNYSGYTNKSIANDTMYQFTCMIFVCACVLYFVYTQVAYSRDWVTRTLNDKLVMKDYKNATDFNPNRLRVASIPLYVFFLIMAVVLYFADFIPYHYFTMGLIIIFDVYLVISPSLTKKSAIGRTKKNIQDSFSEWLRDVSLNLQEEPLISAIRDTYENCPTVLKPELEIFLKRIEKDPASVEPYYEFLARFHILDISSAIRNLYTLSDSGSSNMEEQLAMLVKRNYEIINKNEIAASSDRNAVLHFTEYIPILIASVKLGIDMICLISIMI